jgi:diguanylate cyclase (GGDEF)-like protein
MISLRKHIDEHREAVDEFALTAFRSSLSAIAQCGRRAVPPLGQDLSRKIDQIQGDLQQPVSSDALTAATRRAEAELALWADLAVRLHEDNEREMREIVGAVANAAESLGRRDEKYSSQIGDLSVKLRSIASLNDLAMIRRSIVESAAALKTCVEQMAEESRASVRELSKEVNQYRNRLRESDRISMLDPLTNLANRRAFEGQLQARIEGRAMFSLLMIDLNEFKSVNDRYGHLAGDDLLRQFAAELSGQFSGDDLVGRWGGDEFVVLTACDLKEAHARADRIRHWAMGEYKIKTGTGAMVKVPLQGSIGVAQWNGKEDGAKLLARADAGSYDAKGGLTKSGSKRLKRGAA